MVVIRIWESSWLTLSLKGGYADSFGSRRGARTEREVPRWRTPLPWDIAFSRTPVDKRRPAGPPGLMLGEVGRRQCPPRAVGSPRPLAFGICSPWTRVQSLWWAYCSPPSVPASAEPIRFLTCPPRTAYLLVVRPSIFTRCAPTALIVHPVHRIPPNIIAVGVAVGLGVN